MNDSKKFPVTISLDNQISPLFHSQNIGTDLALSTMNGLAFISHRYGWHNHIIGTLATTVLSFYIALLNHEITEHGLRGQEFGAKIKKIHIGFFHGWTRNAYKPCTIHERDISTINGNQANTILADKITNQLLQNRQAISPVIAATYIFSGANQLHYILRFPKLNFKDDMEQYIENMQLLYGYDAEIVSKMKALACLDFLNPMLFASFYSIISRGDVRVPTYRLGILPVLGETAIMPLTRLILTPYNVLEKRFIVHLDAAYTPIKIEFGFGKELKSNDPVKTNDMVLPHAYGHFTEKDSTNFKRSYTYYGALEVRRLLSMGRIHMGCTLAAWKQPELFVQHPIHAQLKYGMMGLLHFSYKINENFNLIPEVGYKSKGFLIGRPVRGCFLISLTGQWMV